MTYHWRSIWGEQTFVLSPQGNSKQQHPSCAHPCVPIFAFLWSFSLSLAKRTKPVIHGFFSLEAPCEVVQVVVHLSHHITPTNHQKRASCPLLEELITLSISPLWPDSLNYPHCQANASLVGPPRGTSFFSLNHVRIH